MLFLLLMALMVRAYLRHQERMNQPIESSEPRTTDWIQGLKFSVPQHFSLEAQEYRPLSPGHYGLRDVSIQVDRREGQTVRIRAPLGEWREGTSQLQLEGGVNITIGDEISVHTEKGVYFARRLIFRTLSPATWTWHDQKIRGHSGRLIYDEAQKKITSIQGTEIIGTDNEGHEWVLLTRQAVWDLKTRILNVPTTAHLARRQPPGFEIVCPRIVRQPDTPYGDLVRGRPFCSGSLGRDGDQVWKFKAFEVLLLLDRSPRRAVLIQGEVSVEKDWLVRGSPLAIESTQRKGWLKVFSPAGMIIKPLKRNQAIQEVQTHAMLIPVENDSGSEPFNSSNLVNEPHERMIFPQPVRITLEKGRLTAMGGVMNHDRSLTLNGPIEWRYESTIIRAGEAVESDDRWVLTASENQPVVGEMREKRGYLKVEAPRAIQTTTNRWRWGEGAQVTLEDGVFEAPWFEWMPEEERWKLEKVRLGRVWKKRKHKELEINITAGELMGGRQESCIIMRNEVVLTFVNLAEEGPIRMMGSRGRWCSDGWTIEEDTRFIFRDIRGRGDRIYGNLEDGVVWVEGDVSVHQKGGPELRGRKLRLDVENRRIEVINPWPERGELRWPGKNP